LRVSIIVTTYNNPGALVRVLGGLSLQTRHPDEVVVADDGSGPETAQLVFDFSKGATFPIKHAWQEDNGFRAARIRNEAVKQAEGEYIVFMDGDCVPNRHFVADHLALSERGFFVQGKRILLDKEASGGFGPEEANSVGDIMKCLLGGHIGNPHHLLRMPFLPPSRSISMRGIKTCSFGVFREDLMAVNGFNEAFTGWGREDSEFAARLYKYGLRRKEHSFMAICFHLWHLENTRERLSRNEALLSETMAAVDYRCRDGIVK
jgi:glycosyltransferase involved in cell wall biosynthesis